MVSAFEDFSAALTLLRSQRAAPELQRLVTESLEDLEADYAALVSPPACLYACLPVCLCTCLYACLPVCLCTSLAASLPASPS